MELKKSFAFAVVAALYCTSCCTAFLSPFKKSQVSVSPLHLVPNLQPRNYPCRLKSNMGDEEAEGIVELAEDLSETRAPWRQNPMFISQSNELAEDVLSPNFSDPKQTRVVLYLIVSLVPVLLLIPLMIGSRDFIPPEALPPVVM